MLKLAVGFGVLWLLTRSSHARRGFTDKVDFIQQVSAAVRRVAAEFHVPPVPADAFVTAHAGLSSGWGRSRLASEGYNLFGVKAGSTWTGAVITTSTTTEYCQDGKPVKHCAGKPDGTAYKDPPTRWRSYPSLDAAVRAYFVSISQPRYAVPMVALRTGNTSYMADLGRAGWYTNLPEIVSREWLSVLRRVNSALGRRAAV